MPTSITRLDENPALAQAESWYDKDYAAAGFGAQRLYPNEELLRFCGRRLFAKELREDIHILEIGCGSGANLWMLAREGFTATGLDLSVEALRMAQHMLDRWKTGAKLVQGSMTALPFADASFDVVCDVFSSNCLTEKDFALCVAEVARVLKPGGRFFSYIPSTQSDAFKDFAPAVKLDESTLNGVFRETSPFVGNHYPFRFSSPALIEEYANRHGLRVDYLERIGRTYRGGAEYFEFLVVEALKH